MNLFDPDPEPKPLLPFQRHSRESFEAAESMKLHAATLYDRVWRVIKATPEGLTDEEICLVLMMKGDTIRPRRVELMRNKKIHALGKRHTRSGRYATVWVAND